MNDLELLHDFVRTRSDAAFTELVRRHVDLVYSAAWRRTGDAQMAQDVAQAVFIRLARHAASVRDGHALSGWLYRATCFESGSAIRSEQRRRTREHEAMNRAELDAGGATSWAELAPLLDETMQDLNRVEQDALVLRFFEDKSLAEVGRLLGLTEEAARKRVSRALGTLRQGFEQRGVKVATGALATVLTTHAIQAAPAGLAAALAKGALATGAISTGLLSTLLSSIVMTKTTTIVLTLVAAGLLLTPVLTRRDSATETIAPAAPAEGSPDAAPMPAPSTFQPPPARPRPTESAPGASPPLLVRVAALTPLTSAQIQAYVEKNRRNAESLLAAFRISGDQTYLVEAATRFPGDRDVQYAVVASGAFPETRRPWIEAYKQVASENALAWYFSALEHFRSGEKTEAIQDLTEATRKSAFGAELAPTLQAVEELHVHAGRALDEAKVAAFQACAQVPHLTQMRELAKLMQAMAQEFQRQGEDASAKSLAGMGLMLGSHLSAGGGSQTLINQLVGIAIEKMFLPQFDAEGKDSFGRPVAEVSAAITRHQDLIKTLSQNMASLTAQVSDTEWTTYMERVKLYGEEAALTWLKTRHDTP